MIDIKPKCFQKCDCMDMQEEHCTNRDYPVMNKCTVCHFYFAYLERNREPVISGEVYGGLLNAFDQMIGNNVYQNMPMLKCKPARYIKKVVCGECGFSGTLRKLACDKYICNSCYKENMGRAGNEL